MGDKLTVEEIKKLDPYQFMAAFGKKVIHPGGKKSTEELTEMAELKPHHHVLEIGCGVGTTCIDLVKRFGCKITITDIDQNMIEAAKKNVSAAGLDEKLKFSRQIFNNFRFQIIPSMSSSLKPLRCL